jgi:hypothetical protein
MDVLVITGVRRGNDRAGGSHPAPPYSARHGVKSGLLCRVMAGQATRGGTCIISDVGTQSEFVWPCVLDCALVCLLV